MTKSTTHKKSFKAAKLAAKKNPGVRFTADGGDGWTSEVYWHQTWKRFVCTAINPEGMRIV